MYALTANTDLHMFCAEQATQAEIDSGTVFIIALVTATNSQDEAVRATARTSVALNYSHGVSLGE